MLHDYRTRAPICHQQQLFRWSTSEASAAGHAIRSHRPYRSASDSARARRAGVGTSLATTSGMSDHRVEMKQETGAIGYILLWLLGVPASVLFVIFLLRGCT
jgi:hypothetical protein